MALEEEKAILTLQQQLLAAFKPLKDHYLLVAQVKVNDINNLKKVAFILAKKRPASLIVLGTLLNQQAYLMVSVGAALADTYKASDILSSISEFIHGKGGGQSSFAMAAGPRLAGLSQALKKIEQNFA